jgi:hypothetical protein
MHGCELWPISIILFLEMCHFFCVGVTGMKIFGYENSTCKTKTFKKKKKRALREEKPLTRSKSL